MVRACTEQDRQLLITYLKHEPVYNTFMLADIEDFGFSHSFQKIYADIREGNCFGIYLSFYQNLIVYSHQDELDENFLKQLFRESLPDVIMGKLENIRGIKKILTGFELEARGLYLLKEESRLTKETASIHPAAVGDVDDIFDLLQNTPELKHLYTSRQMIEDRIIKQAGIHYFIKSQDQIISHANSAAECEATVMIGGVTTIPAERGQGLASQVVSKLCRDILKKGKLPCLFSSAEEAKNLYLHIGFEKVGEWATLAKKETEPLYDKIPSYVPVYNQLYEDIISGVYPNGTMLPSENILAEKYHVSRNTLRQALTILSQDGYINKHQGKGNYVFYDREKEKKDKIYNFLTQDALAEITRISMDHNFGLPTQIAKAKLELTAAEEVLASNNVYWDHQLPIGQSFIQIPMSVLEEYRIDTDSKDKLLHFMNEAIYREAFEAELTIQIIEADEQVIPYLMVDQDTSLLHIEQLLYDRNQKAIARIKYYFCKDQYQVRFRL